MRRTLSMFETKTGVKVEERDVSGLPEEDVFQIKFQMLTKADLTRYLVDSAEESRDVSGEA